MIETYEALFMLAPSAMVGVVAAAVWIALKIADRGAI